MAKTDYEAWVQRLVHTCLPLDLEKKVLLRQPLTKAEAEKLKDVFSIICESQRLGDHEEAMGKLADLHDEVKRQGLLTRREFRKLGDERERRDKRSPAQRKHIDKAVRLYVLLHDINGASEASFRSCCLRYWKEAEDSFKDIAQYKNFTAYDYKNFYDIQAVKDTITSGE